MKFAIEKISTHLTDATKDEYALSQNVGGAAYVAVCFGTSDECLRELYNRAKTANVNEVAVLFNGKENTYNVDNGIF